MKTITSSEFRKHLKIKLDEVIQDCEPLHIHRVGKEDLVLVPLSEWNAIQETEYLLSSKKNKDILLQSIEDYQTGKDEGKKIDVQDLWK